MIEVDQLTKRYGDILAVDQISFQVKKGDILGFLGPNGAGKSTTMKMLTGFIKPTSGTAKIGGKDIISQSLEVRKMIGYLPESAPSYKEMTVFEFLSFIAEVREYRGQEKQKRIDQVMEKTSLKEVKSQTIDTLSKGYRQRVAFAQALIHDPPVLILDEPTDGLDPNQKHEVRNLIRRMSEDKIILLSTHILEETEAVCNRAVVVNRGKIVADGTPQGLMAQSEIHNAITLKLDLVEGNDYLEKLNALTGVDRVVKKSADEQSIEYVVFSEERKNILKFVSSFVLEQRWGMQEIHLEKGRLDEVFRSITLGNEERYEHH